jgi:hypothetical protein
VQPYPADTPAFTIDGIRLNADPLLMFAIPCNKLGSVVTSVVDESNAFAIIGAIDHAIGQGYP